jgi:hypothetical protein
VLHVIQIILSEDDCGITEKKLLGFLQGMLCLRGHFLILVDININSLLDSLVVLQFLDVILGHLGITHHGCVVT